LKKEEEEEEEEVEEAEAEEVEQEGEDEERRRRTRRTREKDRKWTSVSPCRASRGAMSLRDAPRAALAENVDNLPRNVRKLRADKGVQRPVHGVPTRVMLLPQLLEKVASVHVAPQLLDAVSFTTLSNEKLGTPDLCDLVGLKEIVGLPWAGYSRPLAQLAHDRLVALRRHQPRVFGQPLLELTDRRVKELAMFGPLDRGIGAGTLAGRRHGLSVGAGSRALLVGTIRYSSGGHARPVRVVECALSRWRRS